MILTSVLLSLLNCIMVLQVTSYNWRCPATSEWNLIGKAMCNITDKYFCLYNDVENQYVQGCEGPDFDRKGSKRIFAGDFTRASCELDRFQPYKFWTNGSSDCVNQKSLCNEEGQVIYSNGSSKEDRFCSCDFTSGYAFVLTPRNLCYCDLSVHEDCSCYLKTCTEGYTLSADYECVKNTSKPTICPGRRIEITKDEPDKPILPNPPDVLGTKRVLDIYKQNKLNVFYGTLGALILMIIVVVCFAVLIKRYVTRCHNQPIDKGTSNVHLMIPRSNEHNDNDHSEQEYNDTVGGPQRAQSDVKSSDVSNSSKPGTCNDHPVIQSSSRNIDNGTSNVHLMIPRSNEHNDNGTCNDHPVIQSSSRNIDNDYPKEKWYDTVRRSTASHSSDGSSGWWSCSEKLGIKD